tara:strand:+ start:36 stop:161 length:126 start_codon:yes stop_codon:yes gene_type:complete
VEEPLIEEVQDLLEVVEQVDIEKVKHLFVHPLQLLLLQLPD